MRPISIFSLHCDVLLYVFTHFSILIRVPLNICQRSFASFGAGSRFHFNTCLWGGARMPLTHLAILKRLYAALTLFVKIPTKYSLFAGNQSATVIKYKPNIAYLLVTFNQQRNISPFWSVQLSNIRYLITCYRTVIDILVAFQTL